VLEKITRTVQRPGVVTLAISIIMHLAFVPLLVSGLIHRQADDYIPVYFESLPRDISFHETETQEKEPAYNPPEKPPEGQVVDAPVPHEILDDSTVDDEDVTYLSDKTVRVSKSSKSSAVMAGVYDVGAVTAGPSALQSDEMMPGAVMPEMVAGQQMKEAETAEIPLGKDAVNVQESPPGSAVQIFPTFKAVADAVKGSGLDKLEDVDEGDKTLLNTNEWKHAGFFLRVKNAVAQYWNPGAAFLMYDPSGSVYGYKDRETVVKVVLECDGGIKHLYVAHPSGAKFLDDEALDALRSAGPFPNPPQPLCDPAEKIIVFNFGFFVKVGDKPIIRVKKY
jgi:TonB family protein